MILSCNSCGKKFVVPDSAITASGRVVQCGSCGNKWKQFPENEIKKTKSASPDKKIFPKTPKTQLKTQNPKKNKQTNQHKTKYPPAQPPPIKLPMKEAGNKE